MQSWLVFAGIVVQLSGGAVWANDKIEPMGVYNAELDTLSIDPNLQWWSGVNAASIQVDFDRREMTLVGNRASNCLGPQCPMGLPAPEMVNLPLVSISYDINCGSRVFEASQDKRPVDGMLETVILVDHSTDKCKYLIAVPALEVQYSIRYYSHFSMNEVVLESTFSGKKSLSPAMGLFE